MIRFRFLKDENRYMRLLSDMYRDIASHIHPRVVSRVLRNFGKIEQIVFLEGVRQGLAIAEISNLSEQIGGPITVRSNKPFQAHALVYGSSDTPLSDTEREWLSKLGADEQHGGEAWLESQPMRFAPQTLEEAAQEEAQTEQSAPEAAEPSPAAAEPPWATEDLDGARPLSEDELRKMLGSDETETSVELQPETEGGGPPQEAPAFLDQVRSEIQALQQGGKEFDTWQGLILALHTHMAVDAAFLDLQLTTEMGRAVLDQCGLYNLQPGAALHLSELQRAHNKDAAADSGSDADR